MKRTRNLKKNPDSPHNLILEEVIGLTTRNAHGLASSISTSKCAYIAGCVVVVYDVDSGSQSHLLVRNRMPKPLSCVAVSCDASVIAAGESGRQPAILVWVGKTQAFVCELQGHQYGVACTAFAPDGKCLASLGFPPDGFICLWDWRRKMLLAKVKASPLSSPAASITFSSDSKFIVTVGKNHMKFWKVGWAQGFCVRSRSAASVTMHGKPINLGHHNGWPFVDVTCPLWTERSTVADEPVSIYVVTEEGHLYILHSDSSITHSVELEVKKCYALSTSNSLVACACNNGVVKLFGVDSLEYVGSLCYTETRRCKTSDSGDCNLNIRVELRSLPRLPDAIACQFSTVEKLVVIYDDRSLYIWNVQDVNKATRCCVLVSHNGCIWDIKNVPCEKMHDPSLSCVAKGCSGGLSFATCSTDGTIRLWDLAQQSEFSEDSLSLARNSSSLISEPGGSTCLVSTGIFERDSVTLGVSSPGFRSMAVSSDGKHLAAGDREGNLHIFNLHTSDYMCIQDAHNAEILSLSFSSANRRDTFSTEVLESNLFLASGSRDGTIHLYDVHRNFNLVGSIDCHSSAVTSVKLSCNGCQILSCSADRSLILHNLTISDAERKISYSHRIATGEAIYDMTVDSLMEVAVTVGQDKKINKFDICSGKLTKSFKHEEDIGDPVKVTTDGSCSYLVCSYSNRCLCIFDNTSGKMIARAMGHSDVVTGTVFLPDCRHLVSVSADGCIFVWRIPAPLSLRMLCRTKEIVSPLCPEALPICSSTIDENQYKARLEGSCGSKYPNNIHDRLAIQEVSTKETAGFRFSISQLPKWAQAKVSCPNSRSADASTLSMVELQKLSTSNTDGLQDSSVCLELSSPSRTSLEGMKQFSGTSFRNSSDTDSSEGSPTPKTSSFTLDNRWLTIHTVCMDLDSPECCDWKDPNMPDSATDSMLQDQVIGTCGNKRIKLSSCYPGDIKVLPDCSCCEHGEHVDLPEATLKDLDYLYNSAALFSGTGGNEEKNAHSEANIGSNEPQNGLNEADIELDASIMKSQENDFFDLNFGSLSAQLKREGVKSSPRKSYKSRFIIRREFLGSRKAFSSSQTQDYAATSQHGTKEVNLSAIPSFSHDVSQRTTNCKKEGGNELPTSAGKIHDFPKVPLEVLDSIGVGELPLDVINDQYLEDCHVDQLGKLETVDACYRTLHNLEAAAKNALEVFCRLEKMNLGEEQSRESEIQLYAAAAERLPSISKKVDAVAKLVESARNFSSQKLQDEK